MHSNLLVASPVPKSTPTWSTTMGSLAIVGRFHHILLAVYLASPIFIDKTTAAAASEVVRGGTAHLAGQRRGPKMCPGLVIVSPGGCCPQAIHGTLNPWKRLPRPIVALLALIRHQHPVNPAGSPIRNQTSCRRAQGAGDSFPSTARSFSPPSFFGLRSS